VTVVAAGAASDFMMPNGRGREVAAAEDHSGAHDKTARLTAWADGRVQGVGFRAWVRQRASALGLAGSATNCEDGRVEVIAEGRESACRRLLSELESGATPGRVTRVTHRWGTPRGDLRGFAER
jgi:acylphosphatase